MFSCDQQNLNLFMESFSDKINSTLGAHTPLLHVNRYKLKFKKPCIAVFIRKFIAVRNNLLKKIINSEDPKQKSIFMSTHLIPGQETVKFANGEICF